MFLPSMTDGNSIVSMYSRYRVARCPHEVGTSYPGINLFEPVKIDRFAHSGPPSTSQFPKTPANASK
jgi:hypothetical protein